MMLGRVLAAVVRVGGEDLADVAAVVGEDDVPRIVVVARDAVVKGRLEIALRCRQLEVEDADLDRYDVCADADGTGVVPGVRL